MNKSRQFMISQISGPKLSIRSSIPGRIRLQCDWIRRKNMALLIENRCVNYTNITHVTIHRISGSILICYNPDQLSEIQVYNFVHNILCEMNRNNIEYGFRSNSLISLENTTLISSVISDFFMPTFVPVTAVMLTISCAPNLRKLFEEIRMRQIGIGSLYFSILVVTIISGSFFSAALMGWFFRFWNHKLWREQYMYHCYLISQVDDAIQYYIAHRIIDCKCAYYLSKILKKNFAITQHQRLVIFGQNFANRAVLPTLFASCCGAIVGDLTMMLAILRPDYASASGMIGISGAFYDIKMLLNYSVILLDVRLSEKFANCNLLIIEVEDEWIRDIRIRHFFELIYKIRKNHPKIYIVFVVNSDLNIRDKILANFDGVFVINTCYFNSQKHEFNFPANARVIWVGNSYWKISGNVQSITRIGTKLSEICCDKMEEYSAFVLRNNFDTIAKICTITNHNRSTCNQLHQLIVAPNVFCVVGAFLGGFTSLTAVIVTNLASWNVFRLSRFWRFRQKLCCENSHRTQ